MLVQAQFLRELIRWRKSVPDYTELSKLLTISKPALLQHLAETLTQLEVTLVLCTLQKLLHFILAGRILGLLLICSLGCLRLLKRKPQKHKFTYLKNELGWRFPDTENHTLRRLITIGTFLLLSSPVKAAGAPLEVVQLSNTRGNILAPQKSKGVFPFLGT